MMVAHLVVNLVAYSVQLMVGILVDRLAEQKENLLVEMMVEL
jgi:hypothetical protein